jgi:hypothetical protein
MSEEKEKILRAQALVDSAMLLLQRYGCIEEMELESILTLFMEEALTVKGVRNIIRLLKEKTLDCAELPYGAVLATLKLLRGAERKLGLPQTET